MSFTSGSIWLEVSLACLTKANNIVDAGPSTNTDLLEECLEVSRLAWQNVLELYAEDLSVEARAAIKTATSATLDIQWLLTYQKSANI